MPIPNPSFVACFPLQEYFVDKDTAEALSGGIVTFYQDENRTVKKDVYQQTQLPSGEYTFSVLNNPLTLTSVGTFADDNGNDIIPFLYPYEGSPTDAVRGAIQLYYITVYSSDGILQLTREAWPPNLSQGSNPVSTFEPTENQISNPQFVEISFTPGLTDGSYTYNVSGADFEFEVAPGWSIITNGSGTVTVEQVAVSDSTVASNPPYVLDISSTSISSIKLRQRFQGSPRLFYDGFISAYYLIASLNAEEVFTEMTYIPSDVAADSYILASGFTTADGLLTPITGTKAIDGTASTDEAPDGYVDIEISFEALKHIQITSIQIVSVQNINSSAEFLQESNDRQIDYLFYNYKPQLEYKPIPSYLVAWDFPLNPCQELGTSVGASGLGNNTSRYIADQTIAFESVGNTITYSFGLPNGIVVSTGSNSQFALIQYIDTRLAQELLTQNICSQIKGYLINGSQTSINGNISLWYTTNGSLPSISSNNSVVTSLSSGIPSVASGWTQLNRGKFGSAYFQFNTSNQNLSSFGSEFSFNGWNPTEQSINISTITYMAIVIGFNTLEAGSNVVVNYCTLQGGDLPTRPAPQTKDEVLRQCQYFYEKSYDIATTPGTAITYGQCYSQAFASTAGQLHLQSFNIVYNQIKRANPQITLYSPASTSSGLVQAGILRNNTYPTPSAGSNPNNYSSSTWNSSNISTTKAFMTCNDTATSQMTVSGGYTDGDQGVLFYHYVADARFGVV